MRSQSTKMRRAEQNGNFNNYYKKTNSKLEKIPMLMKKS